MDEHGEERVREALEQALAAGAFDELAVQRLLSTAGDGAGVTVPETLRGYEVECTPAAVYDRLLAAVGSHSDHPPDADAVSRQRTW